MKEYGVSWTETIHANSPEEAAEEARHRLVKLALCAGAPGNPLQLTVLDDDGGKGYHLTFVPGWQ